MREIVGLVGCGLLGGVLAATVGVGVVLGLPTVSGPQTLAIGVVAGAVGTYLGIMTWLAWSSEE